MAVKPKTGLSRQIIQAESRTCMRFLSWLAGVIFFTEAMEKYNTTSRSASGEHSPLTVFAEEGHCQIVI